MSSTICKTYTLPNISLNLKQSQRPANLNLTQPHCNYYVAMAPNENNKEFLDIYLEGSQVGWVAVGFSLNKRMVSIECQYAHIYLLYRLILMLSAASKTVKVTLVLLIVGMEPYHQTRLTQPKKECATTHPLMLMASSLASKDAGRHQV